MMCTQNSGLFILALVFLANRSCEFTLIASFVSLNKRIIHSDMLLFLKKKKDIYGSEQY